MSETRILIVSAGVSEHSSTTMLAERVGREVVKALQREGMQPSLKMVELRGLAGELGAAMATGIVGEELQATLDQVTQADGLIAATPVYKASYSGMFKAFFDMLDEDALILTPTILAATAGTPRHSLVPDDLMRPLFAFMRALAVPTSVFAATEDWSTSSLTARAQRAAEEFAPLVTTDTRKKARESWSQAYDRTYVVGEGAPEDPTTGLNFDSDLMKLAAGGKSPRK